MSCQIDFHSHFTSLHVSQVDYRTWSKQAGSDKTGKRQEQEHDGSTEPQKAALDKTCSRLKNDSLGGTSKNLSLKVGAAFLFHFYKLLLVF